MTVSKVEAQHAIWFLPEEDILWYVKDEKNYTYNKMPSTIKKKKVAALGEKMATHLEPCLMCGQIFLLLFRGLKKVEFHPTQKPLALMERIVALFSNEHDVVIDPFMGTGSTLVACKRLNRNTLGCDISKKCVNITKKRLNNVNI